MMWIVVVGLSSIISVRSRHLEPTSYCFPTTVTRFILSGPSMAIYDTLSFIAVSIQLGRNSHTESDLLGRAKTLAFGDGLPALSKMLLKDGQVYFW